MPQFCPNCKNIISVKVINGNKIPYCFRCGPVDVHFDKKAYTLKKELQTNTSETIIIDRSKQLEELKKQYGKRTYGPQCPNCKSFYLTKQIFITRGDEAGKTFWFCVQCGHQFRRPKYIPRKGAGP